MAGFFLLYGYKAMLMATEVPRWNLFLQQAKQTHSKTITVEAKLVVCNIYSAAQHQVNLKHHAMFLYHIGNFQGIRLQSKLLLFKTKVSI